MRFARFTEFRCTLRELVEAKIMNFTEQQNRYAQQNSSHCALPLNAIMLLALSRISACDNASQQERIEAAKLEAQLTKSVCYFWKGSTSGALVGRLSNRCSITL